MNTTPPAPVAASVPSNFDLLRDPMVTWYGPHQCNGCGRTIIKTGLEFPSLVLDAEDHNHHYPNFRWQEHVCPGTKPLAQKES